MKMATKKKPSLWTFILVVALLTLLLTAYFFLHINWKTYKSEVLSVNYPSSWTVQFEESRKILIMSNISGQLSTLDLGTNELARVTIWQLPKDTADYKTLAEQTVNESRGRVLENKNIVVNGHDAISMQIDNTGVQGAANRSEYRLFINTPSDVYEVFGLVSTKTTNLGYFYYSSIVRGIIKSLTIE